MSLNLRQQKFVSEYIKDRNATRAAQLAGYSQQTAYSIGSRLLKKVEIQTELQQRNAKHVEEDEMDARWVRQHVKDIIVENKAESPMVALKGLELASRYNGMFQDGNVGVGVGLHITLNLGEE